MSWATSRLFATAGASVPAPQATVTVQADGESTTRWGRPYVVTLICLLLLIFVYYIWTAATSIPITFDAPQSDVYNLLTTSFLHGHLYLPLTPTRALLDLKDPYNPAQQPMSVKLAFHDLSLYKDHFYSEWGPTPVITLFAPFRVTGLDMSVPFAVALYVFLGLVCAVLLMHAIVGRFMPGVPRWFMLLATVGVATMSTGGFLLRRPAQYEVAISSGYCFEMAGLALVLTSVFGPRIRRTRMAFGSLCLGLAMGGRPDLVLGGAVALVVAVWCIRRRGATPRLLLWALGPMVACGILLLAYNGLRFGGQITNFGDKYQLAGFEQLHAHYYQLKYILPGLQSYLLVPARLALTFPHAFLMSAAQDPITPPAGYYGSPGSYVEPAGGLLTTAPITLILLLTPLLWARRHAEERRALIVVTGLAALGFGVCLLLSWGIFATTERYEVDFATLLVFPAYLLWALLLVRCARGTFRRYLTVTVVSLFSAFGVFIGLAISITGYVDYLHLEHPSTFSALEDATGPLQTLATIIDGSPQIARVYSTSEPVSFPPITYRTTTDNHATADLGVGVTTVTVVSPDARHAALSAIESITPGLTRGAAKYVVISENGEPTNTVPILYKSIRIPLTLHTGLNRINLTVSGAPTAAGEVTLKNLTLVTG